MMMGVEVGRRGKEEKKEAIPRRRLAPSAWLTERKGREREKPKGGELRKKATQPPPPMGGKERAEPSKEKVRSEGRGEKEVEDERGKIREGEQRGGVGMRWGKKEG
jgi:hypothetical protein